MTKEELNQILEQIPRLDYDSATQVRNKAEDRLLALWFVNKAKYNPRLTFKRCKHCASVDYPNHREDCYGVIHNVKSCWVEKEC